MPLIQDGVAHRVVLDTASGGSTGHASRPGHADPWPDHLVLVGGGAADEDALCAPLQLGLHIPAFLLTAEGGWRLDGARMVEGGRRTDATTGLADLDPLAVLGADGGAHSRPAARADRRRLAAHDRRHDAARRCGR